MVFIIQILSLTIFSFTVSILFLKVEAFIPMMNSLSHKTCLQLENIQVINLTSNKSTFHQFVYHGNITKRTKNEHKRFN